MSRRLTGLIAVIVALLAAAPASASPNDVISDCNLHGTLTQTYSITDLRGALQTIPASAQQYTDCQDVIQQQLLAQIHGHGKAGDPSSGGSFLSTPLVIALVVLVLGGVTVGAVAIRRRQGPPAGP